MCIFVKFDICIIRYLGTVQEITGMITKKLYGKVKKIAGKDTSKERWYEMPVYEYTLHKENSKKKIEGHGIYWNKGDAIIYTVTDRGWAKATVYPIDGSDMAMKAVIGGSDGFKNKETVSGVLDVDKKVIGRTEWDITVDIADGVITNVERKEIRDGVGESKKYKKYRRMRNNQ